MVKEIENQQVVTTAPGQPAIVSRPTARVGWSAVLSGVIATAGIWLLLHVLGLGVGLTAIEPNDPDSLRGVGVGTGIWTLIVPLIALFVGGLITGFLGGTIRVTNAIVHGILVWSIATVLSLSMMLLVVGMMISGAVRAGTEVVRATGAVAETAAMDISGDALPGDTLDELGLSADDLLAPVNRRLREEGKPTVTADELAAAARDALRTGIRQGRFDRELVVSSLAEHTSLTREDAADITDIIERNWEQTTADLSARAERLGEAAETTALQAAESTGKALLWLFVMMMLGLIATAGGVLAVQVPRERRFDHPRAT